MQGAVNLNAFGFELRNEPTLAHRQSMVNTLYPGVDPMTFLEGHAEREKRLYSSEDPVGRYINPPHTRHTLPPFLFPSLSIPHPPSPSPSFHTYTLPFPQPNQHQHTHQPLFFYLPTYPNLR